MRYALDIPYIARENSTAEILALRNAWARGRMATHGSAREQPPILQAAPEHQICRPISPHPGSGNLHQIGGSVCVAEIEH